MTQHLVTADRMWLRMRGLLGRGALRPDEGLHIVPCSSIHMFFMRHAIDAVFLDADHVVVRVFAELGPWRMARGGKGARTVLELPPGTAARHRLEPGVQLELG